MGRNGLLSTLVAVASLSLSVVKAQAPGQCGGCYVQADAVGQVWDSAIHYVTVAEEQYLVDQKNIVTQLVNSWIAPDFDGAVASMTNSLLDSAMHRGYNYDPWVGTVYNAAGKSLVYPTSYLWVQYLTKFYNTTVNGQCTTTSSTTTLRPQALYTIDPAVDKDWLTTIKKDNGDLSTRLNRLPNNVFNTLPGFEGCQFASAAGTPTTKGPVLTTTNTIISYASSVNMHVNPTITPAPGQGPLPGAATATGGAMPGMNHGAGGMSMSTGDNMSMPAGEKMELCDLLSVGAAVFTGISGSFPIGDKTLVPGGSAITLFGTVITEPTPAVAGAAPSVAVVGGVTQTFAKTVMRAEDVNAKTRPPVAGGAKTTAGAKTSAAASGRGSWRVGWMGSICAFWVGGFIYLL